MMDEREKETLQATGTADPFTSSLGTASEVVERYTHCALCGANLHFSHVTDFTTNLTQETAKCPECGIKIRQVLHRLQ